MFLITTKTTGSKRLDPDNAIQTFATLRQRTNESISDFAQRVKAAVDTYILLKITAPTDENQAIGAGAVQTSKRVYKVVIGL